MLDEAVMARAAAGSGTHMTGLVSKQYASAKVYIWMFCCIKATPFLSLEHCEHKLQGLTS